MQARIRRSMADKDQGFTLIELLVVIIIIGILAAIAIPVFLNQRKKAVDASMKSEVKSVAIAMDTYFADFGAYPGNGSVTNPASSAGSDFLSNNQTINTSPGTTISVVGDATSVAPGTFCLWVRTTSPASGQWYYDSDKGGLLPMGSPCTLT